MVVEDGGAIVYAWKRVLGAKGRGWDEGLM